MDSVSLRGVMDWSEVLSDWHRVKIVEGWVPVVGVNSKRGTLCANLDNT